MKILAITSLSFLVLLSACRKDAPPQDPDALLQLMVGTWELEELEYHYMENSTYQTDLLREDVRSNYSDLTRDNSIFIDKKGRLQTSFNFYKIDTSKLNTQIILNEETTTRTAGGKVELARITVEPDGTIHCTTRYIHDEPSTLLYKNAAYPSTNVDTTYAIRMDTVEQSGNLNWEFNEELFIDLLPSLRVRRGNNWVYSLLFGQVVSIDEKCMVLGGSQHWNYVAIDKEFKYVDSLEFPDYRQLFNSHAVRQAVGHQVWKRVKE